MSFDETAGWSLLPGLLDAHEIQLILEGCERLLGVPEEERAARDRPNNGTRHLVDLHQRVDGLGDLFERPALVDALAEIFGEPPTLTQCDFRSPQPGFGDQKLHMDALPRLDVDSGHRVATMILALCDFTEENGSTRIVPGSHRRPDLQQLGGNVDRLEGELQVTCSAGDGILFSGHLLHSGTKNSSDGERPALQIVWNPEGT